MLRRHTYIAPLPDRWNCGEKNCSFHALVLIAQCFGITLSEMLAGLEAGESLESKPVGHRQRRGARRDHGGIDRKKVLQEVMILERTARTLKAIALPKKESQPPNSRERK